MTSSSCPVMVELRLSFFLGVEHLWSYFVSLLSSKISSIQRATLYKFQQDLLLISLHHRLTIRVIFPSKNITLLAVSSLDSDQVIDNSFLCFFRKVGHSSIVWPNPKHS